MERGYAPFGLFPHESMSDGWFVSPGINPGNGRVAGKAFDSIG